MSAIAHKSVGTTTKVECLNCKIVTSHSILAAFKAHQCHPDNEDIWLDTLAQIVQCKGCDSISFRETTISYEDDMMNSEPESHLYPARNKDNRIPIRNAWGSIPNGIYSIYAETIQCYNSQINILCAAGLRTIIEAIFTEKKIVIKDSKEKVIERPSIEAKINHLEKHKIITPTQKESLHELRFLGNTALHQLDKPHKNLLAKALNIIEAVLNNIYIIPLEGEELKQIRERKEAKKASSK
ncbi:MAG: DUF4145 domain-containing protein [Victivallaceae bacterium]|jgi:hypothetical protein